MKTSLRLLMVEDSPEDTLLVLRALRAGGFTPTHERVETAESLALALERDWDLIIADYALPQFSGLAALRMVRERGLDIPFLIVSGTIGDEVAVEAVRAGAHDYLVKDNLARLVPSVERELREALARRDQREAERALRESEERFRCLSASSPLGIMLFDVAGRCVYANPRWRGIFNRTLGESLNAGWLEAVHPDDRGRVSQEWQSQARAGAELSAEFRVQWQIGVVRWVHARTAPMTSDRGEPLGHVGTVEDITERRLAEQQMRQAQKMEALGKLAGGVAHDFNNILTAIMGYSELCLRRVASDAELQRHLEEIRAAAERAAGLTAQLLAFSRRQVLQAQTLDLNQVVLNLQGMLQRLISENVELRTELGEGIGQVKGDRGQIEQVILNLVVNARDAMPEGGRLMLQTERVTADEDLARDHPGLKLGEYVVLAVVDTGMGMSEAVRAHIFEPFFTTKEQGKGTGLGLATCYGVVTQSDGHITVESEEGKGTTFRVYLPRVEAASGGVAKSAQTGALPRGTETVLLVEDEPPLRVLGALVLRELGYHLLEAANGEEALRLLGEAAVERVDLVVTDVVMPVMGGERLAECLGGMFPAIRVLFCSGYPGDAVLRDGDGQPRAAFLQKPFTPAALARAVREVLDG